MFRTPLSKVYVYYENYQASEGDKIETFCRAPLPFPVNPGFWKHIVAIMGSR